MRSVIPLHFLRIRFNALQHQQVIHPLSGKLTLRYWSLPAILSRTRGGSTHGHGRIVPSHALSVMSERLMYARLEGRWLAM
jgi:hypothetical protein